MTLTGWLQIGLVLGLVRSPSGRSAFTWPRVFTAGALSSRPSSDRVERGFYRLAGVSPEKEQGWLAYTLAMLMFSALGFASLYAILRLQAYLPLNPQGFDGVPPGPRLQHRHQLPHQHQLAGLWRRNHHEPFLADGRARGA